MNSEEEEEEEEQRQRQRKGGKAGKYGGRGEGYCEKNMLASHSNCF